MNEAIWWTSVPATGLELRVPPILQPPSGNSLSVALSTWKHESLRLFTSPSVKLPLTSTNAQKTFFYTCVPEGLPSDTSIPIHSAGLSTSWSVAWRVHSDLLLFLQAFCTFCLPTYCCLEGSHPFCSPTVHPGHQLLITFSLPVLLKVGLPSTCPASVDQR